MSVNLRLPNWAIISAGVIVGLALLLAVIIIPVYYFERRACSTRAGEMQLEWKYKMVGGCFVGLPSGRFVNLDNIRFTEQGTILVEP